MLENRKTQRILIWQINKKLWLEINGGWNLFHSSLAIKIYLCSTAAKVSHDEAFTPQFFISMKFEKKKNSDYKLQVMR